MSKQFLKSIWEPIGPQKDAVTAKSSCYPLPYTLVLVERPAVGNRRDIIPCIRLRNLKGGYEYRKCKDIVKPIAKEPLGPYMKRLEAELCRKDILGETIP